MEGKNNIVESYTHWFLALFEANKGFFLLFMALTLLTVIMMVYNTRWKKQEVEKPELRSYRFVKLAILAIFGFIVVFLLQPGRNSTENLIAFLGIVLSGAIGLSSTTFISNFMAGIMIRRVDHFRTGDFLQVDNFFGRVTEMGLLHTEIQTEQSDLTTFPNLYLITKPCKVIRKKQTIVSASVSLGYDIPHDRVKELLTQAAANVPLHEPFVQIMELGDFSITYRASGILENVKQLLSTRSKLREEMLDTLHGAGVEIVSPTFMYTRAQQAGEQVVSRVPNETKTSRDKQDKDADAVIFDKADDAESIENLRKRRKQISDEMESIKEQYSHSSDEKTVERLELEIQWRTTKIKIIDNKIENLENKKQSDYP